MAASSVFTHTNHPAFYYEDMLADKVRMQLYRRAINEVVKPGAIVADLGTGMGVLAMMAIQAGAAHVFAVDNRPQIFPVTQAVVDQNGMTDRITLINGDARTVRLEQKVDVIINELIGDFGTDENIYECVSAFARANLKADGCIMPKGIRTLLVPLEHNDEFRGVWRSDYQGLDLSCVASIPCREEAVMRFLSAQPKELATPAMLEDITFNINMAPRQTRFEGNFQLHSDGVLHGFMGFFETALTDHIRLSNYPQYPGCHWQTWHWPVYPFRRFQVGQHLTAVLNAIPNMVAQGWTLEWSTA
ncbi:50S ribosomal protein L11 methyltransferase [Aliiglaciecola sp. CAU 1673]|uniref:50S ribosomal protein L11 methyltransferase n=1 Tax=Aliiglaciecola sp. CAU 1673 TaxID=3032595 RepID=UPI0023DC1FCB|nr:50S ribosomal protein L11 methyltransferase [Aliiglaciecola sp. CAU 1673]MDF2178064.1 50S ribosomal protein L11 methyltransferase [Aliiglaciecola sp. CAU 1673]